MKKGLYIRIEDSLIRRLDGISAKLGYSRSEAIREAVRRFIVTDMEYSETHRMRGIVKSKMSLTELEETYEALR